MRIRCFVEVIHTCKGVDKMLEQINEVLVDLVWRLVINVIYQFLMEGR